MLCTKLSNATTAVLECFGDDHQAKGFICTTRRNLIAIKQKSISATKSFAEAAQAINIQSNTASTAVSSIVPRPIPMPFNHALNIGSCAQY